METKWSRNILEWRNKRF